MDFRIFKLQLDRNQRKAFILAIALILVAILIKSAIHHLYIPHVYEFSEEDKEKLYSLNVENGSKDTPRQFEKTTYRSNFKDIKKINETRYNESKNWFVFDPNLASEEDLNKLPLPSYVIKNIIKYRATGAKFKNSEHFKKVYGIDPYFEELKPYLVFDESISSDEKKMAKTPMESSEIKKVQWQVSDTGHAENKVADLPKKDNKLVVEINSATEYELMMIPGIGQWYAKKIIETRDKLGGFISKEQIFELSGIPQDKLDNIIKNIRIDPSIVKKLKVNYALNHEIYRHPYFTPKQAKILILYRDHHKGIKNADDLRNVKIFTEEEVHKLLPYLDFSY